MPFGDESETRKSGSDRRPAKGVRKVLRVMGSSNSVAVGIPKSSTSPRNDQRDRQAFGNVAGSVELRIHDQTFPPDRGSRFFKINSMTISKRSLSSSANLAKRSAYSRHAFKS